MRFNRYMDGKFKNCPVLKRFTDTNREREVSLYYIGEDNVVGFFDGVDSFIMPVARSPYKDELAGLIQKARTGKLIVSIERHSVMARRPLHQTKTITRKPLHVN